MLNKMYAVYVGAYDNQVTHCLCATEEEAGLVVILLEGGHDVAGVKNRYDSYDLQSVSYEEVEVFNGNLLTVDKEEAINAIGSIIKKKNDEVRELEHKYNAKIIELNSSKLKNKKLSNNIISVMDELTTVLEKLNK